MFSKLLPLFLSFRKSNNNTHILHSQPTAAGCHYEERTSFLISSVLIPTHLAAKSQKSQNTHAHRFLRQQQTQCVPMLPKSSRLMIHGEWRRGFFSLCENMPLMGILRYLYQSVRSKLESGTSLNIIFFYNHPNCQRKGEGLCAFLSHL